MLRRDRVWLTGLLLAAVCLSGCNGESRDAGTRGTATSSADQTEIAKSNAYITAANESSGTFAKALQTHQDTVASKLAGDRPLEDYAVVPVQDVTKIRARLESAAAMAGSIPELDPAARDYASAIAAFEPVNNGLANYAQSKGFLTDEGAKARAEDEAFVASLRKVVDAETVFFDRIDARDARLTQEAYDRAPEGSVERYRAGIVLRGKAAMKEVLTVFTEPDDVATRQAFAKNLDEMAGMVENWDRAVRTEKPEGCPTLQSRANLVIANGRKAVQSAEEGRFDRDSGTPSFVLQQEFNGLQQNFSMMIFQLNQPFSC
ncbi:DUF3829 domain-containing protein [Aureimonas ureilytica]|uniref:DUF3829 domain-containing protein n=1 Tax=Aureimonas ureilytica TaxID=401562 RepID=UPI000375FB4C|nr:DUF3829 domain-containing protein [Aureimonas ureilytica]